MSTLCDVITGVEKLVIPTEANAEKNGISEWQQDHSSEEYRMRRFLRHILSYKLADMPERRKDKITERLRHNQEEAISNALSEKAQKEHEQQQVSKDFKFVPPFPPQSTYGTTPVSFKRHISSNSDKQEPSKKKSKKKSKKSKTKQPVKSEQ